MYKNYPKTIDQAVELLLTDITLNNEFQISMMNEDDFWIFIPHLADISETRSVFGKAMKS